MSGAIREQCIIWLVGEGVLQIDPTLPHAFKWNSYNAIPPPTILNGS